MNGNGILNQAINQAILHAVRAGDPQKVEMLARIALCISQQVMDLAQKSTPEIRRVLKDVSICEQYLKKESFHE